MAHLTERFVDLLQGTLPQSEQSDAAAHLASCQECARSLAAMRQVEAAVLLSAPAEKPPAHIAARLAQTVGGKRRFAHYEAQIAELFDMSPAEAAALLERLDDREGWEPGPSPGVEVMPVIAGERLQGALTAMVRIPPGERFPVHTHRGEEINFVLQGGFSENGRPVWRGDRVVEADGSSHDQVGLEGLDCLCATVIHGFVEFAPEAA